VSNGKLPFMVIIPNGKAGKLPYMVIVPKGQYENIL
jgi:hypothetical protein